MLFTGGEVLEAAEDIDGGVREVAEGMRGGMGRTGEGEGIGAASAGTTRARRRSICNAVNGTS